MSKHRRGRSRWAFGEPIPEIEPKPFSLPKEFLTDDARKASARNVRRARRERTSGGAH